MKMLYRPYLQGWIVPDFQFANAIANRQLTYLDVEYDYYILKIIDAMKWDYVASTYTFV